MKRLTNIFGLLILISSCKSKLEDEHVFPKIETVTDLEKTDFVPTLESSFSTENNIIYGATFPIAWNEIKNIIGTPLRDFTSKELEELNITKSFINVLNEDEYETSIEVNGNEIRATAFFRKSLPFEEPLTKFSESLKFGKLKVESFGFWGRCRFARINYYNDENNFSISLFPENKEHEIILIMTQKVKNKLSNFTEYLKILNKEKNKNVYFNDDDKVEIPIIEFNLEKKYSQIIGSTFRSGIIEFQVTEAYQRNVFVLNENGAEIESEAEFGIKAIEEFEKPKPKMMIFNKPFVVLLKRKEAGNPYFGVYIANDELMKKK